MRMITLRDRLRYRFDTVMSRGTTALIFWLFFLSACVVFVVSLFVIATQSQPVDDAGNSADFSDLVWMSMLRTLDPGTMGGDHGSALFLGSMLFVTLAGIFVVSTLIGILTTGIDQRLTELRKGRSFVVEQNHSLILGWSEQIFTVISELIIANENKRDACIVILADRDKVEMEDEIRAKFGKTGTTRVVCRTGSPIDVSDLEIANPDGARSIIVLSPGGNNPDLQVIKTLLALLNNPNRKPTPYHIVAEMREHRNMDAARMVGKDEVELVLSGDLVARIAVQTSRQSGLSVVYTELMDFDGNEIYFQEEPKLVGKTFGEAIFEYDTSVIIGLRTAEGNILLNPPSDTPIVSGDRVIAISEDDDTVTVAQTRGEIDISAIRSGAPQPKKPERILILGWNDRVPLVLQELDTYVAPGSEVVVVADVIGAKRELDLGASGIKNQTYSFVFGDSTNREVLESLDVHGFHHILVVSYSERFDVQEADSRTLITLLHLRHIAEQHGHKYSVVSEMLDVRNRNLAVVTDADDFIVSHKLVSLLLSQISENKELSRVFAELFCSEGSELYLREAPRYVECGKPVNFYTVSESARQKGEIAIGYRMCGRAVADEKAYGVKINPPKSQPLTFTEDDKIIVLAKD
ncbi:MAG: potassium transporter TrkA [Bdellovibrionota bacterium]